MVAGVLKSPWASSQHEAGVAVAAALQAGPHAERDVAVACHDEGERVTEDGFVHGDCDRFVDVEHGL